MLRLPAKLGLGSLYLCQADTAASLIVLQARHTGTPTTFNIARLNLDFDSRRATAKWKLLDRLDGYISHDKSSVMACNDRVNTYLACIRSTDLTRLHCYTFDATTLQVTSIGVIEYAEYYEFVMKIHQWQNEIFVVSTGSFIDTCRLNITRYNIQTRV